MMHIYSIVQYIYIYIHIIPSQKANPEISELGLNEP